MRFSLLAGWPLTEPAEAIKRIRAVGPGVPLPVFAFGGAGRDFSPLRTHAYICFHRFGGKVKICTIEGCRFCMYKALRGARGFRTAYEHRSCLFESLLSCFWMYWNLFHRTFFRFSTTLSRCGCNISRWGACGRIFMHTQLIFMHFILMVPLWEHWAVRCGLDDRVRGLFGRKIAAVPVCCHVQSRV